LVEALAAFVVRFGLVLLFLPFSALDKVLNFDNAVDQASSVFKPRALAMVSIFAGLAVELFASLGVLTGAADRLAALVLAVYCALTALLFKQFWRPGDFWTKADGEGRTLFWDFLKNVSLGAGFLLIVVGPNGAGLQPFLASPLASSQPYAAAGASHARGPLQG